MGKVRELLENEIYPNQNRAEALADLDPGQEGLFSFDLYSLELRGRRLFKAMQ